MKVTNGEIRLMREALQKLNALRIPVSVSFRLAKMANRVNICFQDMEIVRLNLVNQYGVKGADGNTNVDLAPIEERVKFWKDFTELLNQEVEIEDFEPVKLPETLEVEPSVLMPLEKFIEV